MILFLVFATAALCALALTPAVANFVTARGVYGHARGAADPASPRVPRLGGVAVCIAASAGVSAAALLGSLGIPGAAGATGFYAAILLSGWLLFAAGLLDDLYDLRPLVKLLAQCAAAVIAFVLGFRVEALTFGEFSLALGWMALPVTLLWVVGVTNAFNLIDGLDGLATGIGVVALASVCVVSLALGNVEVALVCAALGGALAGFLRYNFRPARIFLGDSGSMFVGFMVAVLAVHGSTKSATAVITVVPLLLLALPLLDTSLAIVRRWLRGRPVLGADDRHLHHRLMAVGLTHVRAVILMYLAAAALAVVALVVVFAPPPVVVVTSVLGAVGSVAVLLVGIHRLGYHEFVEAGAVVTTGVLRVRQSIRDQIHARDVSKVIAQAESLDHVRAILDDNASVLGLLSAGVCREDDPFPGRAELPPALAARAWRLECPVGGGPGAEPLVLRVWTEGPGDAGLASADRAARILATAVRQWLVDTAASRSPAAVAAAGRRHSRPEPAVIA